MDMRPFLFCALVVLSGVGQPILNAQIQAPPGQADPGLKQRIGEDGGPEADEDPDPGSAGLQRGRTTLPRGAWGEYPLGAPGEVIEMDVQDGRLHGYISRLGDGESDKGTALTYFFDRSTVSGTQVTFRTRAVHGIWYSFAGEILPSGGEQGAGVKQYALAGTLTEHSNARGTEQPRRVNLRKLPLYGER